MSINKHVIDHKNQLIELAGRETILLGSDVDPLALGPRSAQDLHYNHTEG
jgi:hypothetical protein